MPAMIVWLLGGLASIVGPLAARVLLALGFGMVTYVGADLAIDALKLSAENSLSSLPAVLINFAGLLKVDVALNIIVGAVTARLALAPLKKLQPVSN